MNILDFISLFADICIILIFPIGLFSMLIYLLKTIKKPSGKNNNKEDFNNDYRKAD